MARERGDPDKRQQLLAAARRVFSQKGFHAATVLDITRAAGVAKGTFYLYFPEKPAIFRELIRLFFEAVMEIGRSATQRVQSGAEYFARFEQAAHALAQLLAAQRDVVRLVYRESMGLDAQVERMVRDFHHRIAQVEADNIRAGIALGLFRADLDPLVTAYAHIGMVERVLQQALFDRQFPATPNLVRQLLELAYLGIRRRGPAPASSSG